MLPPGAWWEGFGRGVAVWYVLLWIELRWHARRVVKVETKLCHGHSNAKGNPNEPSAPYQHHRNILTHPLQARPQDLGSRAREVLRVCLAGHAALDPRRVSIERVDPPLAKRPWLWVVVHAQVGGDVLKANSLAEAIKVGGRMAVGGRGCVGGEGWG